MYKAKGIDTSRRPDVVIEFAALDEGDAVVVAGKVRSGYVGFKSNKNENHKASQSSHFGLGRPREIWDETILFPDIK